MLSEFNMLSYVDHTILGVNSVQLYMKVPGCRTSGKTYIQKLLLHLCISGLGQTQTECDRLSVRLRTL